MSAPDGMRHLTNEQLQAIRDEAARQVEGHLRTGFTSLVPTYLRIAETAGKELHRRRRTRVRAGRARRFDWADWVFLGIPSVLVVLVIPGTILLASGFIQ